MPAALARCRIESGSAKALMEDRHSVPYSLRVPAGCGVALHQEAVPSQKQPVVKLSPIEGHEHSCRIEDVPGAASCGRAVSAISASGRIGLEDRAICPRPSSAMPESSSVMIADSSSITIREIGFLMAGVRNLADGGRICCHDQRVPRPRTEAFCYPWRPFCRPAG